MRAKFIYEKFLEDSDPIHDMGIGIDAFIKEHYKFLRGRDIVYILNALSEKGKENIQKGFGDKIERIFLIGNTNIHIEEKIINIIIPYIETGKIIFKSTELNHTDKKLY